MSYERLGSLLTAHCSYGLDKEAVCCTIVHRRFLDVFVDVVIDTSALVAVIVAEPERDRVVELTAGHSLIGADSFPRSRFGLLTQQAAIAAEKEKQCVKDEHAASWCYYC